MLETIDCEVIWDLDWKISIDKWDVKESSRCISGFCDGFILGGITIEVKIAGSIKILQFFFGEFEESGSQFLFFCGVFEEYIWTVERTLLDASRVYIPSFRELEEPCKEFLISVIRFVFCKRSEIELCTDTVFL